MINNTVNVDTAAMLDITGLYTGNSFEIAFKNYTDSTLTVPKNYTGTFVMIICKDAAMTRDFLTINQGTNLTVSGNILTWKMSKDENPFEHYKYYFQIINDIDINTSYVAFKGSIPVNQSR